MQKNSHFHWVLFGLSIPPDIRFLDLCLRVGLAYAAVYIYCGIVYTSS